MLEFRKLHGRSFGLIQLEIWSFNSNHLIINSAARLYLRSGGLNLQLLYNPLQYVSNVNTKAHSKDLDSISVVAEAAKRSNTRAYQTVLRSTGQNDKGSMFDTLWPNHDEVQTVITVKQFRRKRAAVYPLHTFVRGVSYLAPNNYTAQNSPCVWPIIAAAMSEIGRFMTNLRQNNHYT
jgi:hypothetical protein